MRAVKWISIFLLVLIVALVTIYVRRDYVATAAANHLLQPYDFEVSSLRVDSLGSSSARFANIVIVGSAGERIHAKDVLVVLGPSGERLRAVVADTMVVTLANGERQGGTIAEMAKSVLDLPTVLPNAIVQVNSLRVDEYPILNGIEWATPDGRQVLRAKIDQFGILIESSPIEEGINELEIVVAKSDFGSIAEATVAIDRSNGHLDVHGRLRVATDSPLADAVMDADLDLRIGGDATRFSEVEWQVRAEPFDIRSYIEPLDGSLIHVDNLVCGPDPICTLDASLAGQSLSWSGYDVRSATATLPLRVDFSNQDIGVNLLPQARISLLGLTTLDLEIKSVEIETTTGAQLRIGDEWQTQIEEAQLAVNDFRGAGDLVTSVPLTLRDLTISDSGNRISANVSTTPGAQLYWGEIAVSAPIMEGWIRVHRRLLKSELAFHDVLGGMSATAHLERDIDTGEGTLSVDDAIVEFRFSPLSSLFSEWDEPFDLVDGAWRGAINLEWISDGKTARFKGTLASRFDDVDASFEDIAVAGIQGQINGDISSEHGLILRPFEMSIELVDIGLPVEEISFQSSVDLDSLTAEISGLQAQVLGGKALAQPFVFSTETGPGDILLDVKNIQLQLMLELAEFKDVAVTGTVSGILPISTAGESMTISNGQLQSDGDGGTIRYADDSDLKALAANGDFAIVTQYLDNFEFDSLISAVEYNDAGDLVLATRLSGINPDVDPYQPVILNLEVENNVPDLLRSLQAIRSIEDILEQQTRH